MASRIDAVAYLVIRKGAPRGQGRGPGISGRITGVTQAPPAQLSAGSVAVKVRVSLPDTAFRPAIADAVINVGEQDVIVPVVEVEAGDRS